MEIHRDQETGQAIRLRLIKGMDAHQHFREGARIQLITPYVAERFATALAMPNLVPPITTTAQALRYGGDILNAIVGLGMHFRLLLTFYLTDQLDPKEVERACGNHVIAGIKYYPRGLTTNSDAGVTDPAALWTKGTRPYECLRVLAEHGKVLLVHGADGFARGNVKIRTRQYRDGDELDPYDQEPHFLQESLTHILTEHPPLKVSFEHLSTAEGAEFMRLHGGSHLGCGLTPQHLLTSRTDVHRRGLRPHNFWFPVPQGKEHQQELNRFAAEGHDYCYLGSDSAPHYRSAKEAECCVGGVMTAHAGIELYAEAFDKIGALDKLEAFASLNGPKFYGIPTSKEYITLVREPWKVEKPFTCQEVGKGEEEIVPFRLGEMVEWKLVH